MNLTMKSNSILGEKMYVSTLPRGIKCYIIPKSGFKKNQAVVSFAYGSSDINFLAGDKRISTPLGTAHFLEHKMFENEDGNYFNDFVSGGASTNAFTDFSKTAYYFDGSENFYSNLKTLSKMVSKVYLTDENVDKEKGIIKSEISMYDDDPSWKVYYNMLEKLYRFNPIRYGIAGSGKTISGINPETLTTAYEGFYTPGNMSVVVCGDVEPEAVWDTISQNLDKEFLKRKPAKSILYKEPKGISKNFVEAEMGLGVPMFNLGFKLNPKGNSTQQVYGMKMLLDLMVGESSYLFGRLQSSGYLEESLGVQYIWGKDVALAVVIGQSKEPRVIANAIAREISRFKNRGINNDDFYRIKKKHLGRFIRGFNSIEAVCMAQTELLGLNTDLFEAFDVVRYMDIEYLNQLVLQLDKYKAVLSVVK